MNRYGCKRKRSGAAPLHGGLLFTPPEATQRYVTPARPQTLPRPKNNTVTAFAHAPSSAQEFSWWFPPCTVHQTAGHHTWQIHIDATVHATVFLPSTYQRDCAHEKCRYAHSGTYRHHGIAETTYSSSSSSSSSISAASALVFFQLPLWIMGHTLSAHASLIRSTSPITSS